MAPWSSRPGRREPPGAPDPTTNRAFLLLWAEAATTPAAGAATGFRERDRGFRADLRADVAAGMAAGEVRPDADPDAVAVVGQLRGIGLQRLLDPDSVDPAALAPVVADQWRRALAPDPD